MIVRWIESECAMIAVDTDDGALLVHFSQALQINSVQQAYRTLVNRMESFDGTRATIRFSDVTRIDTAYLQLVLSLILTLQQRGIELDWQNDSTHVTEIMALYGVGYDTLVPDSGGR